MWNEGICKNAGTRKDIHLFCSVFFLLRILGWGWNGGMWGWTCTIFAVKGQNVKLSLQSCTKSIVQQLCEKKKKTAAVFLSFGQKLIWRFCSPAVSLMRNTLSAYCTECNQVEKQHRHWSAQTKWQKCFILHRWPMSYSCSCHFHLAAYLFWNFRQFLTCDLTETF